MRKIIKWMMVLVMAVGCAAAMTIAAEAATEGDFTYTVSGEKATITAFNKKATGEVVIPDTLGGYPVTAIGDRAFILCRSLTSVTIPGSVAEIGENAFYGCAGLTNVTIPESVTNIGREAFHGCTGLTEVIINGNIKNIGWDTFRGCSSLVKVVMPDSLSDIDNYAFYECTKLKEISIPSSVTRIGEYAFTKSGIYNDTANWDNGVLYIGDILIEAKMDEIAGEYEIKDGARLIADYGFCYCKNLTKISIPVSMKYIGFAAFYGCNSLSYVAYSGTDNQWKLIEISNEANGNEALNNAYHINNASHSIFEYSIVNDSVTISGVRREISGELIIPDTMGDYPVTAIGGSAFKDCTGITSVTIPEGVTNIGSYAFSDCTGLTSVTIPNSVTSIGDRAFYGCTSLEEMTLPFVGLSRMSSGKEGVFGAIFGYTLNRTSGTVYQYDDRNYDYYYYIPSSLRKVMITDAAKIPENAFYNCNMLTEISINEGITSIGRLAFSGCTGLTSVTIPDSVTSIGNSAFKGCTSLTSVTIPDSVTKIGDEVFSSCTGLTSVTIPDSVTSIGDSAFSRCMGLTSVTIPDSVTKIGDKVFSICTSLTSVTIPDSVTSIGRFAFSDCTSLTSVTIPDSVTSIGDSAFSRCMGLTSVTVPNSVTSIGNSAFSDCTGLTSVTIPNSVTSIGYSAFSGCTGLTNVTIPDSVKSIENGAFSGCTGLTSVTFPDSVIRIGWNVFSDCSNLTEVSMPAGALVIDGNRTLNAVKATLRKITLTSGTKIDDNAFSGFTALEEVILPDELTEIGSNAFANCEKLSKISIPGSVETIGESAFSGCSTLSKISIPGSVETIGESAFSGCTGLTEVTIADGVANIGTSAFSGCSTLSKISIPGSVRTIDDGAFADCGRLRTVTLADGLETVGKNAFKNCGMVRKLTIPDSVAEIGDGAFYGCNSLEEISVPFVGITESSTGADAVFGAIFGRTQTGETEVTLQYPGYYYYIPNSLKKVTVTSAEILPEFAFRNCRRFTEINLTDGLLKIDSSAFESCDALSEITIPDSVTDIADYAFYDCGGLKTVTLGTGIKTIGTDAFSGCKAIETAVYPGSADEWAAVTVEDGNEDLTSKLARTYTYTFKNADGSVFDTGVIPYGTAIPLPEGEPEKANDEKFTYAFAGWAGYSEGMTIEGDITFEPEFEGTLNRYTYRFISNGEVVKEATADYGTVIKAPETAPEGEFPLIFSEWEGFTEGMELTGSIDFNAVFINRSFTVTPEGGEAVTVVYGDEFVLGFSNKPGQHFVGYFTGKDGEGDKITGSDGASLEPFTFDGDITVYPYYVEDLLEKIALLGDETVRTGEDAVYKVRFATAREVSELYLEIRYPESLEFKATNILDAVSADLISSESADGFVTAVFKCVLSGEKTAFEAPVTPFEIVFGVGDGAEDFTIEILASSRMKGDEDFAFSEVFTAETKVNNVIPGDVTGDGVVNKMDALRLKKYLAGLDVEIDLAAADVNCDGVVNKMDALRLKKYLAGQDVKLGE